LESGQWRSNTKRMYEERRMLIGPVISVRINRASESQSGFPCDMERSFSYSQKFLCTFTHTIPVKHRLENCSPHRKAHSFYEGS
jgi:hypothetical protein